MLPYEPKETKYIWGPETDAVSKGSWGWSDTLFIVAGFVPRKLFSLGLIDIMRSPKAQPLSVLDTKPTLPFLRPPGLWTPGLGVGRFRDQSRQE